MLSQDIRIKFYISIHALREEGDQKGGVRMALISVFLSTPSARRATFPLFQILQSVSISIHALREEGDHVDSVRAVYRMQFLSTPSARRETIRVLPYRKHTNISIHALREEGDVLFVCFLHFCRISIHALREEGDTLSSFALLSTSYFYPRPPRGGRLGHPTCSLIVVHISIHALREEGDICPLRLFRG